MMVVAGEPFGQLISRKPIGVVVPAEDPGLIQNGQ